MNETPEKYQERIDQQEWLILQVTLHIEKLMEEKKISRSELAARLGKTKGYVTQLLDGANMSLRKVADVMLALDSSLCIDTKPIGFSTSLKPVSFDAFAEVDYSKYPRVFIKEPVSRPISKEKKQWAKAG